MAQDNTSDYSGSVSSASEEGSYTESSDLEEDNRRKEPLVWIGSGAKQHAVVLFRPDSIMTAEKKLKSIGEKYHMAYKMVKTESKLVRSILQAYGFHEVHPNCPDFNLMWTGAHLKPFSLRSLCEFQRVNHFPRSYEITRKDRIYKNIDRMAHTKGIKHFDFIPKSYLMPSEYQDFCAAFVKEKGSWIVKPIASSRGRGIYLINNPNQVPLEDNIMVCKYINNPLLIDGFKFDVRVYVAVTSYDPLLIYLFEEGLTRFATVKYERTNRHLKNQMMHLTNYSINKKSHDYVRCDDPDVEDYGNKWSMSAMLRYLKQEGVDTALLMTRIEAVIIKSIIAAELPIATACRMFVPYRENCIELYGFDILIDENLKPWLLEGNLSPSLACDAPLDLKIKSSVVADFFSLAGFHCVDPVAKRQSKKQGETFKRPYSASKSASGNLGGSNSKRPSSALSKETIVSSSGLSQEENRVIKFVKEQYHRRGGFVRIFPTADTWEQYSSFLEYKTNLNQLLAQKMFSSHSKSSSNGPYSAAIARVRSMSVHHMLESRNQLISKHVLQYERKLISLDSSKRKNVQATKKRSKTKATPVGIDIKSRSSTRACNQVDDNSSDEIKENEIVNGNGKVRRKKSITNVTTLNNMEQSQVNNETSSKKTTSETSLSKYAVKKVSSTSVSNTASSSSTTIAESIKYDSEITPVIEKDNDPVVPDAKGDNMSVKSVSQRMYTYKSSQQTSNLSNSTANEKSKSAPKKDKIVSKQSNPAVVPNIIKKNSKISVNTTPQNRQQQPKLSQGLSKKKSLSILEQLKSGANLTKAQARHAFSAYLSRVQYRLMFESDGSYHCLPDILAKQEEQMDLVLRFLKRAAGNLRQSFSVTIPSHKLPINDRKRILAKQLGDFVHIYNKETENMLHHHQLDLDSMEKKKDSLTVAATEFTSFVSVATESELEEILTTYTHRNKSASVFLGASRTKTVSSIQNDANDKFDKVANKLNSPYSGELNKQNISSAQKEYSMQPDISENVKTKNSNESHSDYHSISTDPISLKSPSSSSFTANNGFYQGQTSSNEEAIADALQRLSERQAARKYSASSQMNALSQHLTNINLANMTNQRHYNASLVQHRASSLPDLADADPCIQSMIDSTIRENDCRVQTYLANQQHPSPLLQRKFSSMKKLSEKSNQQVSHSQMLAQQSRELLQQSKAKHLAMVAQVHSNSSTSNNNRNTFSVSSPKPPPPHYMSYFSLNSYKQPTSASTANRAYPAVAGLHVLPPTPPPTGANWGDNRAFVLRKTMGAMRRPNTVSNTYTSSKYETKPVISKQPDKPNRIRAVNSLSASNHRKDLKNVATFKTSKLSHSELKR